jgi:hypothetical protein
VHLCHRHHLLLILLLGHLSTTAIVFCVGYACRLH